KAAPKSSVLKSFLMPSFLSGCKITTTKVTVQVIRRIILKVYFQGHSTQFHSLAERKDTVVSFTPARLSESIFNFLSLLIFCSGLTGMHETFLACGLQIYVTRYHPCKVNLPFGSSFFEQPKDVCTHYVQSFKNTGFRPKCERIIGA
ncbi:MAG: hypothetical protein ACI81P_001639, partial [Neolewinella sp.]